MEEEGGEAPSEEPQNEEEEPVPQSAEEVAAAAAAAVAAAEEEENRRLLEKAEETKQLRAKLLGRVVSSATVAAAKRSSTARPRHAPLANSVGWSVGWSPLPSSSQTAPVSPVSPGVNRYYLPGESNESERVVSGAAPARVLYVVPKTAPSPVVSVFAAAEAAGTVVDSVDPLVAPAPVIVTAPVIGTAIVQAPETAATAVETTPIAVAALATVDVPPSTPEPDFYVDTEGTTWYLDGPGGRVLELGWRRQEDAEGEVWYTCGDESEWLPRYAFSDEKEERKFMRRRR